MKIILAHNHGHKNIGDDAMAANVYRKLKVLDSDIKTISTYSPPREHNALKDCWSLSRIINNYDSVIVKSFIVACHRFRLKPLYAAYVLIRCVHAYWVARLRKTAGVAPTFSENLRKLVDSIACSDLYVRSGSGSLNDIWFWSSMVPQLTEAKIARIFGAKVAFTGQGVGPLKDGFRRMALKELLRCCDAFTFRDTKFSMDLCVEVAPEVSHLRSVGDDALDFPLKQPDPEIRAIVESTDNLIVCQFRPTDYEKTYSDGDWESIAAYLSQVTNDHPEVYFCFVSFSDGKVNDIVAAERILAYYPHDNAGILKFRLDSGTARWVLSKAVLAIGQSYHFGVFALGESVPFIGLYRNEYYKLKLEGLLDWYDSIDCAISIDQIELLPRIVGALLEKQVAFRIRANEVNQEIEADINRTLISICSD